MLGKRSRLSTIGKLAGALRSSGIVDSATSPRSPLDCGMQSPRGGQKNYDQQGGVGLGIIVSLDNNNNNTSKSGGEIIVAKYALCTSSPIPMNKSNECEAREEELTYVASHVTEKSITTRVYCDGAEYGHIMNQNMGVFNISSSPARLFDDSYRSSDYDFLSSCQLCRKTLHGKDIYMYKGEKAFCSEECRQRQIGIDERKEKYRSKASRSSNVSSSPYSYTNTGGKLFSAGIVAV